MKRRYIIQQRLRCSRITGHFFNREPSETCWFCRLHVPPKRVPLIDGKEFDQCACGKNKRATEKTCWDCAHIDGCPSQENG